MRFLTKNDFIATFCKATNLNLAALGSMFNLDEKFKFNKKTTYFYISKDLTICGTTLKKKDIKQLNLKQIKMIDGYWYLKSDLK